MARNSAHDLLTTPTAETAAKQRYVLALKKHVEQLRRKSRSIYDARIRDAVPAGPEQDKAVLAALYKDEIYQTICALKYIGQERMWSAISESVEPATDKMSAVFTQYAAASDRLGTLTLDPDLVLPKEFHNVRVHLQPGGYLADDGPDDVTAGAYYEEGGALYSQGQDVGTRESKAECLIRFLRQWKSDFRPRNILDMACSVGASSVPYALAFPDAEVHAVDIAPALLRYGHARAESIGGKVHFHQQDVNQTRFDDESFDLVVSHNAMHEMSSATQQAMFRESYRLLKPGGICMHQDLPLDYSKLDSFDRAERTFDRWFNGELYWTDYAESDCKAMFENAGFDVSNGYFDVIEQADNTMKWYVAAAVK